MGGAIGNMVGTVGNMFGASSGNKGGAGLNYEAGSANVRSPVTDKQATDAYNQSQAAYGQQQNLLAALQQQGGMGHQQNVYSGFMDAAKQADQGPYIAQSMLNQATGQNVANTQALMGSARGASSNPALMARLGAQQGSQIQQQAAGQQATAAIQEDYQRHQAKMNALQGAGSMANQQTGQQIGATQNLNQMAQSEQQALLNSIAGVNSANVSNMSSQNSANAGVSGIAAQQQGNMFSNIMSSLGGGMFGAHGGEAGHLGMYADGGNVEMAQPQPMGSPSSFTGQYLQNMQQAPEATLAPQIHIDKWTPPDKDKDDKGGGGDPMSALGGGGGESTSMAGGAGDAGGMGDMAGMATMFAAKGGGVSDNQVNQLLELLSRGGAAPGAKKTEELKPVPGKAKTPGDSLKNDTVPAMLSPGEVVIPRSVMNSKNPSKGAALFVAKILKDKKKKAGR